MDTLIFSISFTLISIAAFFAAKLFDKRILVPFVMIGGLYLGLDDLVTGLASAYGNIGFIGGDWNWTGKIFSLCLSALTIYAFKLSPQTVGLTLWRFIYQAASLPDCAIRRDAVKMPLPNRTSGRRPFILVVMRMHEDIE